MKILKHIEASRSCRVNRSWITTESYNPCRVV